MSIPSNTVMCCAWIVLNKHTSTLDLLHWHQTCKSNDLLVKLPRGSLIRGDIAGNDSAKFLFPSNVLLLVFVCFCVVCFYPVWQSWDPAGSFLIIRKRYCHWFYVQVWSCRFIRNLLTFSAASKGWCEALAPDICGAVATRCYDGWNASGTWHLDRFGDLLTWKGSGLKNTKIQYNMIQLYKIIISHLSWPKLIWQCSHADRNITKDCYLWPILSQNPGILLQVTFVMGIQRKIDELGDKIWAQASQPSPKLAHIRWNPWIMADGLRRITQVSGLDKNGGRWIGESIIQDAVSSVWQMKYPFSSSVHSWTIGAGMIMKIPTFSTSTSYHQNPPNVSTCWKRISKVT